MTGIINSASYPRFINGKLTKTIEGDLFLKTSSGSIPVRIEGASVPLGQEVLFEFLRAEPGRLLLTPLTEWESLRQALPFLEGMSQAEQGTWEELVKAAVQEGLPLDQDVLLSLRKWSLTAEKSWGVKVAPQVFAFLLNKGLPVTQATVLWALYTRYPAVQKEIWRQLWLTQKQDDPAQTLGQSLPEHKGAPAQALNQGGMVRTPSESWQKIAATIKGLAELLGEGEKNIPTLNRTSQSQQGKTSPTGEGFLPDGPGKTPGVIKGVIQDPPEVLLFSSEKSDEESTGPTGAGKGIEQFGEKLPLDADRPQQSAEMRGKVSTRPHEEAIDRQKPEITPESDQEEVEDEILKGKAEYTYDPKEMWTEILRESSRFLAAQSREDQTLAQLILCLFPHRDKEVLWESRGQDQTEQENGYSFRLSYHSQELQEVEIIGAYAKSGLELLIEVEDISRLQPHFADLKDFLASRGWNIKRIRVAEKKQGPKERTIPQRIDGWV